MYSQAQAQRLIDTIQTVETCYQDEYLFSRLLELEKVTRLHPVHMNREQILWEIANGRWTEERVWGNPERSWECSEYRVGTVGEYYLYRLSGGAEMCNPSDATGRFPRLAEQGEPIEA